MTHQILSYGKNKPARGIETDDIDMAHRVAAALKTAHWKVVWMVHSMDSVQPQQGWEKEYEEWKEASK